MLYTAKESLTSACLLQMHEIIIEGGCVHWLRTCMRCSAHLQIQLFTKHTESWRSALLPSRHAHSPKHTHSLPCRRLRWPALACSVSTLLRLTHMPLQVTLMPIRARALNTHSVTGEGIPAPGSGPTVHTALLVESPAVALRLSWPTVQQLELQS